VFAPWPGQKSISNTAYPNYFTASEIDFENDHQNAIKCRVLGHAKFFRKQN